MVDTALPIHAAWRAEVLVDALANNLRGPLADPFATELVLVDSPGIERWLQHELAVRLGTSCLGDDGLCAGIDFRPPRHALCDLMADVAGHDQAWTRQRVTWALLQIIDEVQAAPWFAPVATYLRSPAERPGRRLAFATNLAATFDDYSWHRPDAMVAWSSGGTDTPPGLEWQPPLWRALREILGPAPAEVAADVTSQLLADGAAISWPHRITVWHPLQLSATERRLLMAVAAHRELTVYWPHAPGDQPGVLPTLSGQSAQHISLLGQASLRQDSQGFDESVLGQLRRALLTGSFSAATDTSVTFHSSHGIQRQVEVLRDVVTGLLADDPTLEPRDIVVACPAINDYAGPIADAFGLTLSIEEPAAHPAQRLPIRLADASLREANPVLAALQHVVQLGIGRGLPSELMTLCSLPPVAQRFGFTDDDLNRLAVLIAQSGMKWGMDAAQRCDHGYAAMTGDTWDVAIDRMLAGIALPPEVFISHIAPLPDVPSNDVALIGRFAAVAVTLQRLRPRLIGTHHLAAWMDICREILTTTTAVDPADSWQTQHAWGALADISTVTGDGEVHLSGHDLLAVLAESLRGRSPRSAFGSGAITVCTPDMVRAVPHRAVCLIGFDDRSTHRLPHDSLLGIDPRPGEPDARGAQRQALFDAVCAARERLAVIVAGRDERTNEPKPLPVALGGLWGVVCAIDQQAAICTHPLQPFSPSNFDSANPLSFDTVALAGARELCHPPEPRPQVWSLDQVDTEGNQPVDIAAVCDFFRKPLTAYLRQRGLYTWSSVDEPSDNLALTLNHLEAWQMRNRMVQGLLRQVPIADLAEAERHRGILPPAALGRRELDRAHADVQTLAREADELLTRPVEHVAVTVESLGITGTVGVRGTSIVGLVPNPWPKPRDRVVQWIQLLALTAAQPDMPWDAALFGLKRTTVHQRPAAAETILGDLMGIYRRGLTQPLPLHPDVCYEWVNTRGHVSQRSWSFREDKQLWDRFYPELSDFTTHPEFAIMSSTVWEPLLAAETIRRSR